MDSRKITLEQIINTNCIRYNRLVQMVNSSFAGSNATVVNVYIDLYSIFKPLYKSNYDMPDYSVITSSIINLCAHYRRFFNYNYSTYAKFYLVYSRNCPDYCVGRYRDYNAKNAYMMKVNTFVDDVIHYNLRLLELLCPYLPDIHFIKNTFETGVIMYDLILRNKQEHPEEVNIVLTKDSYNFQLASCAPDTVIFRPKKKAGEDLSYAVNYNNAIEAFIADRESTRGVKATYGLSPELLPHVMCLSSVPNRNIRMLTTITKALSILYDAVSHYRLQNQYNPNPHVVWRALGEKITDKLSTNDNGYTARFYNIDIRNQYLLYYNSAYRNSIQLLNLSDPNTVQAINNQYFTNNPLDLQGL